MLFENDNFSVLEATAALSFKKLDYQYSLLMMEHAQNLAAIEYKAVCENCSEDDLTMLYTCEAEENAQKSQSIFRKIINVIKAILKKIKEFLFGSKDDEIDPNQKIQLKEDPDVLADNAKGLTAGLKSILNGAKDIPTAVKIALGVVPVAVTAGVYMKKKKKCAEPSNEIFGAELDSCAEMLQKRTYTAEQTKLIHTLINAIKDRAQRISAVFSDAEKQVKRKANVGGKYANDVTSEMSNKIKGINFIDSNNIDELKRNGETVAGYVSKLNAQLAKDQKEYDAVAKNINSGKYTGDKLKKLEAKRDGFNARIEDNRDNVKHVQKLLQRYQEKIKALGGSAPADKKSEDNDSDKKE